MSTESFNREYFIELTNRPGTCQQLAGYLGVSVQAVYRWRQHVVPRRKYWTGVVTVLKADEDRLFPGRSSQGVSSTVDSLFPERKVHRNSRRSKFVTRTPNEC